MTLALPIYTYMFYNAFYPFHLGRCIFSGFFLPILVHCAGEGDNTVFYRNAYFGSR